MVASCRLRGKVTVMGSGVSLAASCIFAFKYCVWVSSMGMVYGWRRLRVGGIWRRHTVLGLWG